MFDLAPVGRWHLEGGRLTGVGLRENCWVVVDLTDCYEMNYFWQTALEMYFPYLSWYVDLLYRHQDCPHLKINHLKIRISYKH